MRTIRTYYHGTTAENAGAIQTGGVDIEAKRRSDPGDFGWGFYLTGSLVRAKQYGNAILAVTIDPADFAFLDKPYFLDGLNTVEPTTDDELLFYSLAFDDRGRMLTCDQRGDERVATCRAIRDTFIERGFAGIATPFEDGEVVVFDPARIHSIEFHFLQM